MMSNKQIASAYNALVNKVGERAAYETFLEKNPDYEDELNQLVQGTLDLTVELPVDRLTSVEDLMEAPDDEDGLDVAGLRDALEGDMLDDDEIPVPVRAPRVKVEKPAEPVKAAPKAAKPVKTPKAEKVTKKAAPAVDKQPSKADRALAIYQAAPDKSRKVIIALFIDQLGMTSAGAATYLQNIKKKLGA